MEADIASQLERCWALCRRGDPQSAMSEGMRLRDVALERACPEAAAQASSMIGWFCFQLGEVEVGIEHAFAAKNFWAETQNCEREAWTGSVYAWLLLEAGLADEAADEAFKALSMAEHCGHEITLSWAINVLGVIFWGCKQTDRARILCERAVAMVRPLGDDVLLSWWIINLAGVHAEIGYQNQTESDLTAEDHFRLALSINDEAIVASRKVGDHWGLRIALANAAEYLTELGQVAEADRSLREWENLPNSHGSRAAAHYLYTKGQLLLKQGRLTEALSVCANALALAESKRHSEYEAYALRYLSEIYEALGRFDTALAYFKRFHDTQARVAAEKTQRRTRLAEIHYDTQRFKRLAETASQRADEMALTTMLDPLTGLGNRRQLDQAMALIKTQVMSFAIAVVDLDHFKAINDRYSHMVGDKVLKLVAQVLQSIVRKDDIVVRLGGEEFVIVMYDADLRSATTRCVTLNEQVATADWGQIEPTLRVTASIGVATGERDDDASAVLALADRRLYVAKSAGRNRVVGAPDNTNDDWSRIGSTFERSVLHRLPSHAGASRTVDVQTALRNLA